MENLEVPKEDKKDIVYNLVKGGIGAVPIVGSIAAETFSLIITEPITKRRESWMQSVVEKLYEIEQKNEGFINKLKNNDEFISVLLETTQIAFKTHQQEKIDLLRNILSNFFTNQSLEYDKKYSFLKVLDEISPTHLRVLQFIFNDEKFIKDYDLEYKQLYKKYEEIEEIDEFFFRKCILDLDRLGLLRYHKADYFTNVNIQGEYIKHPKTTSFGEEFLKFIEDN